MTNSMTSFVEILRYLSDYNQPFPAKYLQLFTDITGDDQSLLTQAWQNLKDTRKLSLLEDLEDLSEHDTLMDFTSIGKIALKDPDDQVREAALGLLWETQDKSLVPILINLLQSDHNGRVRATAASVLGHYVYLGETEEIPVTLKEMIESALFKAHRSDSEKLVKRRSLESLGYSSHEQVSELIKEALNSGDLEWLSSSLYAMGRSADSDWAEQITKYIDHTDELVREEAIRAAGELGLQAVRENLINLLSVEEDDELRATIIWSLSQIGGEGVREAILKQIDHLNDEEMTDFIEDALDNLDFTEELSQFDLFDLDDLKDTE